MLSAEVHCLFRFLVTNLLLLHCIQSRQNVGLISTASSAFIMHDWSLMISQTTIGLTHDIQCVREKYRVREKSVLFSIKRIKIVKIKLDWLDISRDRKHLYCWRRQAILWNLAILSPRPCLNSLYVYYYALPWRIPQHSTALILSLLFLLWAFSLPIFLSSAVGTHITRERGKVMESSKIDPTFPMPESVCTVYMNCCVGQQPPRPRL